MISLYQNFKPKSNVYFVFVYIKIFLLWLQITARNSKTKCHKNYILVEVVRVLALV